MLNKENKFILKQLFFLLKNSFIGSLASYILSIYLANNLGPKLFGEYSYMLLIGMITSTIVAFSTDKTAVILRHKYSASEVFYKVFSVRLFLFGFILMLLLLLALFTEKYVFYFGIFVITFISLNLSFLYEINVNNIKYSYIYIIERLVYVAIVFIVIYLDYLDLLNIFLVLFLASAVSLAYQLFENRAYVKKFMFVKIQVIIHILKDNLSLTIITFSTFAYGGFSRIILESKLGFYDLGIYSAGWQIVMAITIYQSQIDRIWRIKFAQTLIDNNYQGFVSNLRTFFVFTFPPIIVLSAILFIFKVELINFVFKNEYAEIVELIPLYSIYFIVISFNALSIMLWISIGNKKQYLKINIVSSLVLITVLLLSPKEIGILGFTVIVVFIHLLSVIYLLGRFYVSYILPMKLGGKENE